MGRAEKPIPNQLLRKERELRGWSQKDVATQLGAASYYVSRWERGNSTPSPHFRQQLCKLFNKNAQELGLLQEAPEPVIAPEQAAATESLTTNELSGGPIVSLYDPAIPLPLTEAGGLIGRTETLALLKQRLCAGDGVTLMALNGLPGVGKTTLAVALAHNLGVQQHFHDGILWCGLGPHPNLLNLLSRWGALLGIASQELEGSQCPETWAIAIRNAIGLRQMLLVIDDAWKIEEALAFKVGGPHCAYLLTTRQPEVALHFARAGTTFVEELSQDDGLRLLMRLAPQVVESEPEEAQTLVRAVGGLPLALTLMGSYLRVQSYSQQQRRVQKALARLSRAEHRLQLEQPQSSLESHPSLPPGAPLSLHTIIGVSDDALEQTARYTLRSLALFPAKPNTFSEEAALYVAHSQPEILDRLSDAGLLESSGSGRYTLHQTIADYTRLQGVDAAAAERLIAYAATFVKEHGHQHHLVEQESGTIFAALQLAQEQQNWPALIQIVHLFYPFLESRALYSQAETWLHQAQEAAHALADREAEATTLFHLSLLARQQGERQRMKPLLLEALALAQQGSNVAQISLLLAHLGALVSRRGDYPQAEHYLQESLTLARQIEHFEYAALALFNLGLTAERQGNLPGAEIYFQEALTLARRASQRERLCQMLLNLGVSAGRRGEHARAEAYLQEGLTLARQIGDMASTSHILANIAEAVSQQGNYERAEAYLQEGLALARQIRHPTRIIHHLLNLAELASKHRADKRAERYVEEGLILARQIGARQYICLLLMVQSEVLEHQRQLELAEATMGESLALAQEFDDYRYSGLIRLRWGELQSRLQHHDQAVKAFSELLATVPTIYQDLRSKAQQNLDRLLTPETRRS